ncbi:GGDEF domain-containing protein [Rhizobium skierniewicense]|uniref:GGDEF domain-containing protein n=1 Tax=Rhizobium skierniewicense TaxID=984260 RepID=UPI001572BD77|nr:GGDEF domain-containing protein [Rhizobium skierniewicense]NTF33971.1 GGDEF domain-containing protein [Rhizobium skierniewicense]
MLAFIDRYVKEACSTNRFETRRDVLFFALTITLYVTIVADVLNILAHYTLNALGLLPYAVVPAATVGVIISTLVASSLTFSIVYIVGIAIHHLTISRATFERLSRTDMLSGLLNRRAFLEEAVRAPANSSLILFDIDKFKSINDRYGHDIGDQAIIAVANQLSDIFAQSQAVARIGGEEFAVLVSALSRTERLALAQRCVELIAAKPFSAGGKGFRITISGGVADHEDHSTFETLFKACDKALYLAKASGRNRIVHSSETKPLERQDKKRATLSL